MNHFKTYKWRMYADKNIDKNTIDFLRKKNMDVLSIAEDNKLTNQEDSFHYKKAKQLNRYLLTYDRDFWNDQQFKIHESPGVFILTSTDKETTKYLPLLLNNLLIDCNPHDSPLVLKCIKIKLSPEGMIIKMLNCNSQKVEEKYQWKDFFAMQNC